MILAGDEVVFRNNDHVYKVRAVNPDGVTVEVGGEYFPVTWEKADELGMKQVVVRKKKYTVALSIRVRVEVDSEDGPQAIKEAENIVLGGLNSVEGIRAEKNLPPVVVTRND